MPTEAEKEIRSLIDRAGSISFSRFMDGALYGKNGFYTERGVAGRRGDFITSPEVGPLFGQLVARYVDRKWHELGKPDPFFFVDWGAGPGTLTLSLLKAQPECAKALRCLLIEKSATQRSLHNEFIKLEEPANVLGPFMEEDEELEPVQGMGPLVCSLPELPARRFSGVIFANELFDNIPFDIAAKVKSGWQEQLVTWRDDSFAWAHGPLPETESDWLSEHLPSVADGTVLPLHRQAKRQLHAALDLLDFGALIALDYGGSTRDLAARSPEWLRTYREHVRSHDPLMEPGLFDITTDVDFDQLFATNSPLKRRTQSEFLTELGIDGLVAEGEKEWASRAHIGDLQALKAKSRANEAAALKDPNSLGSFIVAEWSA